MKSHRALWRVLCWTGVMVFLNAAVSTCLSYEPKVENEPEVADTVGARAVVDTVPMPIFKQDSLTFRDSTFADTLYIRAQEQKPFYKRWWFIAAVAGVVTASIVAILSGSDDEGKQNLPDFPDPPEQ
jgi:hypothetical protein